MKKLLMVTNAPICPVINGSRKRMYNLVKLLEKAGFEILETNYQGEWVNITAKKC